MTFCTPGNAVVSPDLELLSVAVELRHRVIVELLLPGLLYPNQPDADEEHAKVELWDKISASLSLSSACTASPNLSPARAPSPAMLRPPAAVGNLPTELATLP